MPRSLKKIAKQPRNKRIPETRVSEEELEIIMEKFRHSGLSFSEFHRQALLKANVIVRDNALDKKAIYQLMAVGNNLNQLTRKTHINDAIDTEYLWETLDYINIVLQEILDGS